MLARSGIGCVYGNSKLLVSLTVDEPVSTGRGTAVRKLDIRAHHVYEWRRTLIWGFCQNSASVQNGIVPHYPRIPTQFLPALPVYVHIHEKTSELGGLSDLLPRVSVNALNTRPNRYLVQSRISVFPFSVCRR